MNNMRDIGLALMLYEGDFQRLPPKASQVADFMNPKAPGWRPNCLQAISVYLQSQQQGFSSRIYSCPEAKKPGDGSDATAMSSTSYLPNAVAMELSQARIPKPSEVILIQETIRLVSYTALRPAVASEFGGVPGEYTAWHDNITPTAGLPLGTETIASFTPKAATSSSPTVMPVSQGDGAAAWHFGLTDGSSGKAQGSQAADCLACTNPPLTSLEEDQRDSAGRVGPFR